MIMALTWLISQLVIVILRSVRGILGTNPGPGRVCGGSAGDALAARQQDGSAGRVEGGRLGWPRAGALDELSSEGPEFDVAVLRRRAQDRERVRGSDPSLAHEHADRLVDDRAGGQRGTELISEGNMVGQPDGDRQGPRGVVRETLGAAGRRLPEGSCYLRIQVERADGSAAAAERERQRGPDSVLKGRGRIGGPPLVAGQVLD